MNEYKVMQKLAKRTETGKTENASPKLLLVTNAPCHLVTHGNQGIVQIARFLLWTYGQNKPTLRI